MAEMSQPQIFILLASLTVIWSVVWPVVSFLWEYLCFKFTMARMNAELRKHREAWEKIPPAFRGEPKDDD